MNRIVQGDASVPTATWTQDDLGAHRDAALRGDQGRADTSGHDGHADVLIGDGSPHADGRPHADGSPHDGGPADGRPRADGGKPRRGFEVVLWSEKDSLIRANGFNGAYDIPRIQAAMDDLGATAVSKRLTLDGDYDDLLKFLQKTEDTRIKVWAHLPWNCKQKLPLCPGCPSGAPACVSWAAHLATLSLEYPNLQVMRLNDLAPTKDTHSLVTPQWFESILVAKNAVNPSFRVIPVMYYDSRNELKQCTPGNRFHKVFKDGVTFPYSASFRGVDYVDLKKLQNYVDEADTLVHPVPFITTIYQTSGGTLHRTRDPDQYFYDPALLRGMLEIATEKSDGLGLFWFPLYIYDTDHLLKATVFQQQKNDKPDYAYKLTPGKGTPMTSWYQAIKASVPSGKVRVRFHAKDTARDTVGCGWMLKQMLIGGKIVWEKDVCDDGNDRATVDASSSTSTRSDVVVRILATQSNGINLSMYVNVPQVFVNGNKVAADWSFDSSLANMDDYEQMYETVKSVLSKR